MCQQKDTSDDSKQQEKPEEKLENVFPNYGWLCPRCGRGLSPFTSTCPCVPQSMIVTC